VYKRQGISSIFSELIIENSVIDNNFANTDGGAIQMIGGSLYMSDSFLILNQTLASGGGIHASFLAYDNQPTIALDRVLVLDNFAAKSGGGLYLSGTENTLANVLINRSTIQSNEAQFGGGLRQDGSINTHIIATNFYNNNAAFQQGATSANGGAMMMTLGSTPFKPNSIIRHSAFIENSAEDNGGAVVVSAGNLDLLNVTISNNQSSAASAIDSSSSKVSFTHVTLYGNDSNDDIALALDEDSEFEVVNSLLVGQCELDERYTISGGGNIESPADTCGIGSGINDHFSVSPVFLLDPLLAEQGGPTPTHAIESTSLALDNGVPITITTTDQRFMPRDSMPDTGAFERQAFESELIYKNGFGS